MSTKQTKKDAAERRNKERREDYAANSKYRHQAVTATRTTYRRKHKVKDRNTCRAALRKFDDLGKARQIKKAGLMVEAVTFTDSEFARAIGKHVTVVRRWIVADIMPPPRRRAFRSDTGSSKVYRAAHVREMIEVLAGHFKETSYLRRDHIETVLNLWRCKA